MGANDGLDDIVVLKGLEGVRRRPGMYVGDTTDGSGLHNLLWEIVSNVVDQHLARYATELHVEVANDGWVSVRDDGPGIPVDTVPQTGRSVLETVFTTLHSGATYDGHFPHIHIRRAVMGVGLAAVNALSSQLEVETTRDGVRWAMSFARGEPQSELQNLGQTTVDGTAICFHPDPEIFANIELDEAEVAARLQHIAWLNPLLRVFLRERRLTARGGIREWARELAAQHGKPEAVYSTSQTVDGVFVDLALAWATAGEPDVRCFVNVQETTSGTHVDGIWKGLGDAAKALGTNVTSRAAVRDQLAPGLVAIVHVGLFDPKFGGPTREHLESPVAGSSVAHVIANDLPNALQHDWQLRRFIRGRLDIPER